MFNSNTDQQPRGSRQLAGKLTEIMNDIKAFFSKELNNLVPKIVDYYAPKEEDYWNYEIEDYIVTDDNWNAAINFAYAIYNSIINSIKDINTSVDDCTRNYKYLSEKEIRQKYINKVAEWITNINLSESIEFINNRLIDSVESVTREISQINLELAQAEEEKRKNNVELFGDNVNNKIVDNIAEKDRVKVINDIIESVGEIKSNSATVKRATYHKGNEIFELIKKRKINISFTIDNTNSYEVWLANKNSTYRLVVFQDKTKMKICVFFTPDHYGNNGKNIQKSSFIQLDIDKIYDTFCKKEK